MRLDSEGHGKGEVMSYEERSVRITSHHIEEKTLSIVLELVYLNKRANSVAACACPEPPFAENLSTTKQTSMCTSSTGLPPRHNKERPVRRSTVCPVLPMKFRHWVSPEALPLPWKHSEEMCVYVINEPINSA